MFIFFICVRLNPLCTLQRIVLKGCANITSVKLESDPGSLKILESLLYSGTTELV